MIVFDSISPYWTIVCVVLGLAYGLLLYNNKDSKELLSSKVYFTLIFLRSSSVCLLLFLLVSPFIKTTTVLSEKPIVIIAQDNSLSVTLNNKSDSLLYYNSLKQLEDNIGKQALVKSFSFGSIVNEGLSKSFDQKETNFDNLITYINNRFIYSNVAAIIIASDGLYNKGVSPQYSKLKIDAPVYSILLGDTLVKKDIYIKRVDYNETAFLGNDFQLRVFIEGSESKGSLSKIVVIDNEKVIYSQPLNINTDRFSELRTIQLSATEKGIHNYKIKIEPVEGEISKANNLKEIAVDVLDVKKKILLISSLPHPDIGVISRSLSLKESYEVITSLEENLAKVNIKDFDAVILYQMPSFYSSNDFINKVFSSQVPVWVIVGKSSDVNKFNSVDQPVRLKSFRNQYNEVGAWYNSGFQSFVVSDFLSKKSLLMPPLISPMAQIEVNNSYISLFNQQIGSVKTEIPLMLFSSVNGKRLCYLLGEGLWKWRMNDFLLNNNTDNFDLLVSQVAQYLVSSEKNKKFNVKLSSKIIDENESLVFWVELYNDNNELINDSEVTLELKSDKGYKYSFVFNKVDKGYYLDAGILPSGKYSYEAKVVLNNNTLVNKGSVLVKDISLEEYQTVADIDVMRMLAYQNNGDIFFIEDIDKVTNNINKEDFLKTIIHNKEDYQEIINNKLIFILIVLLISIEWFIRKRNGLL